MDGQKEKLGMSDVLKKFFSDGKKTEAQIQEEIRGLTAGDRVELARMAAKELGVELIE